MNKLCETKPNSRKSEMNLTNTMTSSYSNNPKLRPMQKQSQTNPNQTHLKLNFNHIKAKTNPKLRHNILPILPISPILTKDFLNRPPIGILPILTLKEYYTVIDVKIGKI
jgi:hypothetical protein